MSVAVIDRNDVVLRGWLSAPAELLGEVDAPASGDDPGEDTAGTH